MTQEGPYPGTERPPPSANERLSTYCRRETTWQLGYCTFGTGSGAPWPFLHSYSPECVEGKFSELRAEGQINRLGDALSSAHPVGCPWPGPLRSPLEPGTTGPGRTVFCEVHFNRVLRSSPWGRSPNFACEPFSEVRNVLPRLSNRKDTLHGGCASRSKACTLVRVYVAGWAFAGSQPIPAEATEVAQKGANPDEARDATGYGVVWCARWPGPCGRPDAK